MISASLTHRPHRYIPLFACVVAVTAAFVAAPPLPGLRWAGHTAARARRVEVPSNVKPFLEGHR
jgi:hypothetical protein